MNDHSRRAGVVAYIITAGFLLLVVAGALKSRHPWSLVCYNCKQCSATCVLGIDPSGFLTASNVNDPSLYISATNIRLTVKQACAIDRNMIVDYEGKNVPVRSLPLNSPSDSQRTVTTVRLKAMDAAEFCLRCNACAKICAYKAPILEVVHDLRSVRTQGGGQ